MMEKKKASAKAADPRTLFVKFHPPSAVITRQHLSDHFSNYGPINRASVIRQKQPKQSYEQDEDGDEKPNMDRGSRGFGFVRFVHEDDAKAAAEAIAKKSGGKKSGEVMVVDGVTYKLHAERAVDATSSSKKEKEESSSKKEKEEVVAEDVPAADASSSKMDPAAFKAEAKRKRTSRVIIRNLSFYANEKHIKSTMESTFGPVAEVNLPLVPSLPNEAQNSKKSNVPRHRGFAFVTFASAASAKKAVEKGSEVKIKNRLVAIDFSVSKQEHQKMMKEADKKEESDSESSSSDSEDNDEEDKDDAGSDEKSDRESSGSESEEGSDSEEDESDEDESDEEDESKPTKEKAAPKFDATEAQRTLFLRNIPFDATRHDLFELFREFGRIQAVYLVKDPKTGVFRGTAFVRFENEKGTTAALEASGGGTKDQDDTTFVSSKNIAVGLGQNGSMTSLTLKGRPILVDLAVDRTTASSLAVQRDEDGKPIKKMVGKDRRNLYLKNEGRVSSSADGAGAASAGAKHGGVWEDLPTADRAKRERAFADKSTKLRSPLFFINPTRISIRNLGKHVNEAALKKLAFRALQTGLEQKLVTPKDAVAHWRAKGDLAHSEVMRQATDMNLVVPPVDEKNVKLSIPSVFVDRAVSEGQKAVDAPSKGFGFVEFTHHAHALAALRQLNNNPAYSAEYAAGGNKAAEMQKRGKKSKKVKADGKEGAEFLGEDGRVYLPRLIVEFAVENKVKARQQAEKVAQKEANKIKQKIEKREKGSKEKKTQKGRGSLQREKKRARKEEATKGKIDDNEEVEKIEEVTEEKPTKKQKMIKPPKKQKRNKDGLDDLINEYKSSFTKGISNAAVENEQASSTTANDRSSVAKRRWFE
eukprot:CAMPEP_0113417860 /NCGR_PEP_ID=MMETSP0013_2-20120614/25883_1 /TAXON_ID=2843 ORGANISM="Skeletonema costatum, Strain 1716" /NCGR_SAMPLE_ID=MMETSP0013_2 /ASSEMBLY_ACC=CAM_ASM_000158 /LENGTH=869 /DNA_ID=CAMNT_0000305027 /DNA_START=108 /DNA_END=2717 /DNA_ORIENTATION=+ /assembly_acc=CAM_ASM_000158